MNTNKNLKCYKRIYLASVLLELKVRDDLSESIAFAQGHGFVADAVYDVTKLTNETTLLQTTVKCLRIAAPLIRKQALALLLGRCLASDVSAYAKTVTHTHTHTHTHCYETNLVVYCVSAHIMLQSVTKL